MSILPPEIASLIRLYIEGDGRIQIYYKARVYDFTIWRGYGEETTNGLLSPCSIECSYASSWRGVYNFFDICFYYPQLGWNLNNKLGTYLHAGRNNWSTNLM